MMRRLAGRIGVVVAVVAVLVGLSGPVHPAADQLASEAWATGLAANYYGDMDFADNAVFGIATTSICSGYGLAASFAFGGPWAPSLSRQRAASRWLRERGRACLERFIGCGVHPRASFRGRGRRHAHRVAKSGRDHRFRRHAAGDSGRWRGRTRRAGVAHSKTRSEPSLRGVSGLSAARGLDGVRWRSRRPPRRSASLGLAGTVHASDARLRGRRGGRRCVPAGASQSAVIVIAGRPLEAGRPVRDVEETVRKMERCESS